ncbi:MAG: O-antigen ligase family protein [Patescibacteria group bacterium]
MDKKLTKFLRTALEYSFYLFVFLLPWQTKLILRPAAINFNEISLYAGQLLLLVILIIFFIRKIRRREADGKITALWVSLVAAEVFVLVSFFFAPDQILAFYHYVLILMGIGLFYLLREETTTDDAGGERCLDRFKIIYSFLASLFLQAILGIYQFLSQSAPICKYLGLAGHDSNILGTAVVETASGRWLRAYGGLDHPNIFGGVLAIALILVAYLLARKKIIRSVREVGESIFLFVFYFVALFALFFSFSRAAWLALVAGLLVLLITLIIQKDRWILGRFLALMFFSVVMIMIVAVPYRDLIQTRLTGAGRLEQKSLVSRWQYLDESESLIREKGLFGGGIGNYSLILEKRDASAKNPWDYQPVHNVFLLLWAEAGIGALLFFAAFLFCLIKKDRQAAYSAAVFTAVIILMLFDHWLLSLPFGVLFLFLVLGLI